ncbi:cytochrome P450 [Pholiota molesta]|nr:cytochrome P450 [Pholiota molesta]
MSLTLYQAAGVVAAVWLLWKTLKQWVLKSPLDNIPGPPAESFWTGVFGKIFNNNAWEYHRYLADTCTLIFPCFVENELFIFDPKAMHHIFVKDQHIFEETDTFIKGCNLWFGEGLLGTLGEQHRKQRKMLNPVFSIAHMREMSTTQFYDVTYKVSYGPQEIEVLLWMTRTALELIGQSGLGYSFDGLTEDSVPHPSVLQQGFNKLRYTNNYLIPTLSTIGPAWFRRWVVDTLPWKNAHDLRDIVDILHKTSVEIFELKKKALADGDEAVASQIGRGKDIMSILSNKLVYLPRTLIFAAMDTTTSALARLLHLIATHQDVQDKLQGGELPYDKIVALPYLDAVCRETLRLARQDVVVPLFTPIKGLDGQELKEILVPKNTKVTIGLLASNTNAELWGPDVHEWKPERWLNPLPDAVSAAHLPGIYSNLGFKFSQLEMSSFR